MALSDIMFSSHGFDARRVLKLLRDEVEARLAAIEGQTLQVSTWKNSVRVATTGNLVGTRSSNVLTMTSNGALAAIDGVSLSVGDRLLIWQQSTGADNGIYTVTSLGGASTPASFTRATDANTSAEVLPGMQVRVIAGTLQAGWNFYLSNATAPTLNTTALTFVGSRPLGAATQAGPYHTVQGLVLANVADLSAFTVAGNDGNTYVAGDRVLLVKQTSALEDGIYVVGTVGGGTAPLTRATDWASTSVQPERSVVAVANGTIGRNTEWFSTVAGAVTVGTTAPAFYPKRIMAISAALSGTPGVLAISTGWILHATNSKVLLSRKAPAGTTGDLSYGTLVAGAGNGSFTITSTGNETSTVAYEIVN